MKIGQFALAWLLASGCVLQPMARAVDTVNILVTGDLAAVPTVSISSGSTANAGLGTEGFFVDSGSVMGEFPIRIGADAANDYAGGLLMASVSEMGRDYPTPSGLPETVFGTAAVGPDSSSQSINGRGQSGALSISTWRAGIADSSDRFATPGGTRINANLAAAYFPFSQGWVGGTFTSSSVSGTGDAVTYGAFDGLLGNGVTLAHVEEDYYEIGYHRITIPGVTDTRRQGLLFATVADHLGRFATAGPVSDGSAYVVSTLDNDNFFAGDPDQSNEDDARQSPVSVVFIPKGTPNITMGSVHGATIEPSQSGSAIVATPLLSSGDFTLTREGSGLFRLSIPNQGPATGTLLLNTGTTGAGQGGNVSDNVVTYRADGNDWLIVSEDPEANSAYAGTFDTPLTGNGQTNPNVEVYFNFAFIPHAADTSAPGPIPDVAAVTNFSSRRIFGWRAEVTEYTPGNGTGDMGHEVVGGTSDLNIQALYDNRGDVGVFVDGGFLSTAEGVLFATINEGFRSNFATGGLEEYGMISVSNDLHNNFQNQSGAAAPADIGNWKIHTSITDPDNGEHNVNYSAVYIGVDSGFQLGNKIPTLNGIINNLTVSGISDTSQGALFTIAHGNDDNYTSATPNGTGWDIRVRDNGFVFSDGTTIETGTDEINYVYLPYDAANLVAGQANPDGSLVNSTDPFAFSLTRELVDLPDDFDPTPRPAYRLSIAGKTPADGMLLLTNTELETDTSMIYVEDGNDFLILGLDHRRSDEPFVFTTPTDAGFYFAYIDFDDAPFLPGGLACDFNADGLCNLDDIDALTGQLAAGGSDLQFDVDGNGSVDQDDLAAWLVSAGTENIGASYLVGDANLDGVVDVSDFNIWNGNKFVATDRWSEGDLNADGVSDVSDFNLWNGNKFQASSVAAVPEPGAALLWGLAMVMVWARPRRGR